MKVQNRRRGRARHLRRDRPGARPGWLLDRAKGRPLRSNHEPRRRPRNSRYVRRAERAHEGRPQSGVSFGVTGQYDLPNSPFGLRVDMPTLLHSTSPFRTKPMTSSARASAASACRSSSRSAHSSPPVRHGRPGNSDLHVRADPVARPAVPVVEHRHRGRARWRPRAGPAAIHDQCGSRRPFGTFQFDNDMGEGGGRRQLQNNIFMSLAVRLRLQ